MSSRSEACSGDRSFFSYWEGLTDGQQKTVMTATILATVIIGVVGIYFLARSAALPSHTPITSNDATILARSTVSPNGALQSTLHINNSIGIGEAQAAYRKLLEEAIKAGDDLRKILIEKGFCTWDQLDAFLDKVKGLNEIPYIPSNYPWDIFWNNRFQAAGPPHHFIVDIVGFDRLLNILKSVRV